MTETAVAERPLAEQAVDYAPPTEALQQPRRSPLRRLRLRPVLGFLLAWAILVGVWEAAAATGVIHPAILPPPSTFLPTLFGGTLSTGVGPDQVKYSTAIVDTLLRVLAGFTLGLVAALLVGTLLAALTPVRVVLAPMVQTIAPVAPVAWVPVALALLGTGGGAAIFVVFMGMFATMSLATMAALTEVPTELVKAARSLGTRGWRLWTRVILPAAAPALATAARLSFFAAWMAVLAGEMAGIHSGLGAVIILGQQQFQMDIVMVGVVTIGVLGFGIDRLLLLLRRRLLWWEGRGRGSAGTEHA
jgi:NitT/TauT family transport system permease protein